MLPPHSTCRFVLVIVSCAALACAAGGSEPSGEWIPLFNGQDLTGWYTMLSGHGRDSDPDQLIQIHDGMIHTYKDALDGREQAFGYFATQAEYSHYRLRFQYKWGRKRFAPRAQSLRDAGMLYHVFSEKSTHGIWPCCIECQVQEGDTGDLITVDTCCTITVDPATKDAEYPTFQEPSDGGIVHDNKWYINASKTCDSLDDWNSVEVIVRGSQSAVYIVNGQINQRATNLRRLHQDNWVPLEKGRIAFQLEGAEIFYRDIEIQPLSSTADPAIGLPEKQSDKGPRPADATDATRLGSTDLKLPPIEVPEGFRVEWLPLRRSLNIQ